MQLPDGRRERISGTPDVANTKTATEAAEREHIRRLLYPTAAPLSAREVPTVDDYADRFLEGVAAGGKPSAIASRKQIMTAYILPRFGKRRLDDFVQEDVDAWITALLVGRGRKTVNNVLAVMSSLLRYAATNRVIPTPDLKFFVKGNDVELVAVAEVDLVELVEHAGDPRYAVAVLLGYDAGLRIGEIRGLQRGDINELRRELRVARAIDVRNNVEATKNRRHRVVPLSDRLRAALAALPESGSRWLLARPDGRYLGYYAMLEQLHAIYVRAQVAPPPEPWHCLRHGFCTRLAERGVRLEVIRDLAGHESIQTTLRYVHVDGEAKRDAIAAAFGQGAGKGKMVGKKKPGTQAT